LWVLVVLGAPLTALSEATHRLLESQSTGVVAESKILAVRAVMVVQAAVAVAVVVLEEREPQDHPVKGMTGVMEP
jgi:hypothetical protein